MLCFVVIVKSFNVEFICGIKGEIREDKINNVFGSGFFVDGIIRGFKIK